MNKISSISLTKKLFGVFIIYLIVATVYAEIYFSLCVSDPKNFVFNADIKERVISLESKWWQNKIIEDVLPRIRPIKPETTIVGNIRTIRTVKLSFPFVLGKDTIYLTDSSQIPSIAFQLAQEYDKRHGIIWDYSDFFYFSIITISTVGYGDILPNSTVVRMTVVSEILIGQLIIIVILNFVISDIGKKRSKLSNSDHKSSVAA